MCIQYSVCWVKNKSSTARKNEFTATLPIEQICFTFRVLILLFLCCTAKLYYSKSGLHFHFLAGSRGFPSSETQEQLVGTTGFSLAKVYNKSGRAPGHLLLPNEFQKRLKSRLLIGQKYFFWPISEEEQPGDSHVFLHEVVFLINRRSSVARSTGTFLRRASEKK